MSDCEQCAALQRQNDLLANDRDGYVQLLTNDNNKLRAENEKLRAALKPFANLTIKGDEPDVWAKKFPRFFELITTARAALEGK